MTQLADAPAPSPPPRALTPKARRRAWAEPRVRIWWLAAIVLFGIVIGFGLDQFLDWLAERRLIESGTPIRARVDVAGGIGMPEKKIEPYERVELSFDWKGQRQHVEGYLAGRKEFIITGHDVDIHVDPNNPERWTAQTEPKPLVTHLLGSLLVLPVALLTTLIALWARSRVVKTWRDGEAHRVVVVEQNQTSLAPMSRAVRCTLADGDDKRLITVFLPQRLGRWEKGDGLWLIFPPSKPDRAVAAVAYE